MKRKLIAFLCIGAAVMMLAGCSNSDSAASESVGTDASVETLETVVEVETEAVSTEASQDAVSTESPAAVSDAESGDVYEVHKEEIDSIGDDMRAAAYEDALEKAEALASSGADVSALVSALDNLVNNALPNVYVTTEDFSGNTQIYGDDQIVIDKDTNIIPFINVDGSYMRMQIGWVSTIGDSDYFGVYPEVIELKASDSERLTWSDIQFDEMVMESNDLDTTVVTERTLDDDQVPFLGALGNATPGEAMMRVTSNVNTKMDYTFTEQELTACRNMYEFYNALIEAIAQYNEIKP